MRFALFLSAFTMLRAQGPAPRTGVADYPAHAQMDAVTLAAEYLVHSLPTPNGTLIAKDYLVVEIAFFGPSFSRLKISPDHFTLRINGKGAPLSSQLPGMVSESIKFPSAHPHLEATGTAGVGDGTVTVGPRPPASRFPGDGNDRTAPGTTVTQKEKEQEDSIDHRVQSASLPEGEQTLPRSGLIYFPFRGNAKNIHSVELLYDGPMGKASLKLLP
jgi:hypothetical protein